MANSDDRDDDGDGRSPRRSGRGRDVLDLGRDDAPRRRGRGDGERDDGDRRDRSVRDEGRDDDGGRDERWSRGERRDRRDRDDRQDRDQRRDDDDDARPVGRRRASRDDEHDDNDRDDDDRDDDDRRGRRRRSRRDDQAGENARSSKDDAQTSDDKDGDKKDAGKDESQKAKDESQAQRRGRRPLIIAIVVIVAIVGIAAGVWYWLSHRFKVDTDDAYTDGNIVTIAPQVSGQVISLEVNDNQFVHKGDVLVRIDPRQFVYDREQSQGTLDSTKAQIANQKLGVEIAKKNFPAALQLARANLESAQANLALQKQNYDRQKSLPKQATTQQEVDTATSNLQQAQAQVDQAEARVVQAEPVQQNIGQSQEQVSQLQGQSEQAQGRLDQSNLNVEWSVVRAPQDGWVTRRNVNAGNYVTSGTQIMSLVTTDVWVTANYKETQLDGMRPGQKVTITVDAYPDLELHGHVDSIQQGSGSRFSAFPAENATGNFIKIVQRVPVKIVIDSGLKSDEPLPIGVSVIPTVMLK